MERYQVILAYDGTEFHGSQFQVDTRTVQGVLQSALQKLNWTGNAVLFAGRTDAGVHASGQVAVFDLAWDHTLEDLQNALNALLPKDIAVYQVIRRSPDFHPRFDAISRFYRYSIYCQAARNPLLDRFSWKVWPAPDMERLRAAAGLFVGVRDFAGYGRPTREGGSTIRELKTVKWLVSGNEWIFEICGNAFLYHMVRRLVFAQVMVGQGRVEFDELTRHLDNPGTEPFQGLAPAKGLTLVSVAYPE